MEEFKRKANPEAERIGKKITEEAIKVWQEEHDGLKKLIYWRKKKLEEILRRTEKRRLK